MPTTLHGLTRDRIDDALNRLIDNLVNIKDETGEFLLRLDDGREIAFVQIAGLVARRIICHLKPGQAVAAGERYGLIRFGSRTDIYLPDGVHPQVIVGQTTIGGETVIADLNSAEPARLGEVR